MNMWVHTPKVLVLLIVSVAIVPAAVRRFQRFNGLSEDGVVGHRTTLLMNIPVGARAKLIEMSMENWRWMDHDLEDPYIHVDIAGFGVQAVVGDEVMVEMRVIVGKHHHESSIFSNHIKYIEFNPYWT